MTVATLRGAIAVEIGDRDGARLLIDRSEDHGLFELTVGLLELDAGRAFTTQRKHNLDATIAVDARRVR